MLALLTYVVTLSLLSIVQSSTESCSAIVAFVRSYATDPSSNISIETIPSKQALFPPYTYELTPTELVILDDVTDDPCDPNGITTDLSNKIVLMCECTGECSIQYKVSVAQQNNAIAVLMGQVDYDDDGNLPLLPDDDTVTTNIPVRTIKIEDIDELKANIALGSSISIEYSCDKTVNYSSTVCILDYEGNYWYLEGEYQLQSDITHNDHSVWKKEGYMGYSDDVYLFLYDANGDSYSEWYWAITLDNTFSKTNQIHAICADHDISHPSLCPSWNVNNLNYRHSEQEPFVHYAHLNITQAQCPQRGSHICIQSTQSNLAGLKGTYVQFHPSVSHYYRILHDCNTRPGVFLRYNEWYGWMGSQSYWELYETATMLIISECAINDNGSYAERQSQESSPVFCKDWTTIVNNSLELWPENQLEDPTLSITEGECSDDIKTECVETTAPDTFCMKDNSIMHRYLEGEYHKTGVLGPNYDTPEYMGQLPYYDDETLDVYVWWHGEIPEEHHLSFLSGYWVISPHSLNDALQLAESDSDDISLYGYCEAIVSNPIDCTAGWSFYYNAAYYYDNTFNLQPGSCTDDEFDPLTVDWPQYVCVQSVNYTAVAYDDFSSDLDPNFYSGGYTIYYGYPNMYDYHGDPVWIKPHNDYWDKDIFLWYDSVFKMWKIGDDLHRELRQLVCVKEREHGHFPMDCDEWYEINNTNLHGNDPYYGFNSDYYLANAVHGLYLYECTADDVLDLSAYESTEEGNAKTSNGSANGKSVNGWMVVTIIMIILLVIMVIAVVILYKRQSRKEVYFQNAETIKPVSDDDDQETIDIQNI